MPKYKEIESTDGGKFRLLSTRLQEMYKGKILKIFKLGLVSQLPNGILNHKSNDKSKELWQEPLIEDNILD